MKKILALAVSVLMFGSLMLFTACGEENIGKMSGNFKKEATAEEFAVAAERMQDAAEQDKVLGGDLESENWTFGLDSRAKLTVKTTVNDTESSVKLDAGYKISFTNEKAEDKITTKITGAGDVSYNEGGSKSDEKSFKFYNDSEFAYIDMSSVTEGMKIKMELKNVLSMLMLFANSSSGLSVSMSVNDGESAADAEMSATVEIQEVFSTLVSAGCKVYIDDSNGLKIKISVTAEALTQLLSEAFADMEIPVPYSVSAAAKCDLYFALDKEDKFAQVSADFDISLAGAATGGSAESASVTLKGGFYVKAYTGTVALPADIDTYSENLLPGLFPGV